MSQTTEKRWPTFRELKDMRVEEIAEVLESARHPAEEALKDMEADLAKWEQKYGMPTHIFIEKWRQFQLDELHDFFVWESDYEIYQKYKERLNGNRSGTD